MGLFGKSKKEREKEYMNRLDVPYILAFFTITLSPFSNCSLETPLNPSPTCSVLYPQPFDFRSFVCISMVVIIVSNTPPLCLKEDFELIIDDIFTIMGVGTVATGNISTGMCREGENACVYKTNGGVLETIITTIDIHKKNENQMVVDIKQNMLDLG